MPTYLPTTAQTTINILPLEVGTSLTISAPPSAIEGQPFNVTGMLTRDDTGAGLPGETISPSYNGVTLADVQTQADGSYSFTMSIAEAGSFTLTVGFAGSTRPGLRLGPSVARATIGAMATLIPLYASVIVAVALVSLSLIMSKK